MMRFISGYVCRFLYAIGVLQALLALEKRFGWRHHAIVLLYHHIRADDETLAPLSQVEEGVCQTAFETQIREFRHWYDPCTPAELYVALASSRPLNHDGLLVTFDDGYRDNRTLAGPILRRHGLIGLVFLATGYIESSKRFWWTRVNDVVRSFSEASLARARMLSNGSQLTPVLTKASVQDESRRRDFRVEVAATLESLSEREQHAELDRLERAAGRSVAPCLPLLTWDEIHEMQSEGFEFGAHTVTHPNLTSVSEAQLSAEIEESAQSLDEQLGKCPKTFAYPYGKYNQHVVAEVGRAEFDAAYAACPGVVIPGHTCRFRIPRIQLVASDPARLTALIATLKMSKYAPSLLKPVLSRVFREPFAVGPAAHPSIGGL